MSGIHSAQLGSELSRKLWTKLNRIRTYQYHCNYLINKWCIRDNPAYDCDARLQTMNHIVSKCEEKKFNGILNELQVIKDKAIRWINNLDIDIPRPRLEFTTTKTLLLFYFFFLINYNSYNYITIGCICNNFKVMWKKNHN